MIMTMADATSCSLAAKAGAASKDYCLSDTMELACPASHVLLIHAANYGRMKAGSCVTDSQGYAMGCYADVTGHVSEKCTGREACSMFVGTLDAVTQPCPKDFKSYLQVNYSCLYGEHDFKSSRCSNRLK